LPDRFVEHGDPAQVLRGLGLDAAGIEVAIRERFQAASTHSSPGKP
jgi:1-deoxy-D-xylulose-5-phosphate synthase